MLKEYKIAFIVTSVIAVAIVTFMYSKNYITFESGIHIVLPSAPDESYVKKEFQPANIESNEPNEVTEVSRVKIIPPSTDMSEVEHSRFFDDILKAIETFMPLLVTLIPIYLHKKKKKRVVETADA